MDSTRLRGNRLQVITHHLNIDPSYKPVKQKKRHFGLEKDKIIQAEVSKLMAAGHIKKIQFPEWLSNVVLVLKPEGKWRMCIDFRDLNKACPKDFTRYTNRSTRGFYIRLRIAQHDGRLTRIPSDHVGPRGPEEGQFHHL
ncbi:UNVERIFIED_CONTAM: hypothetical protein Sradi_3602200 [Sesamum radiatum]|uniref:Uncharacterized protein n=1 Tax=Sesamum radiatum TaxID=300843 RepID=A0AAW2QHH8_SESRA